MTYQVMKMQYRVPRPCCEDLSDHFCHHRLIVAFIAELTRGIPCPIVVVLESDQSLFWLDIHVCADPREKVGKYEVRWDSQLPSGDETPNDRGVQRNRHRYHLGAVRCGVVVACRAHCELELVSDNAEHSCTYIATGVAKPGTQLDPHSTDSESVMWTGRGSPVCPLAKSTQRLVEPFVGGPIG